MATNITKIYDLKLQGQKELLAEMTRVNKLFDESKKNFQALKAETGKMKSVEIVQARIETEKLRQESVRLTNEAKALAIATKIQREEQKRVKDEAKASLTEYQKLSRQLNQMRNDAKDTALKFGLDSNEFKQAEAQVTSLDNKLKAIDARLGQFQRNVGNYPKTIGLSSIDSGVIQSLQNSGLGEVIATQINKAKNKVTELDRELLDLKNQLNIVKTTGAASFESLEQKIIENRKAAADYNAEIKRTQTQLQGVGNIGAQISNTLKGHFSDLKGQIASFALGYVGFQAATNLASRIKNDALAFDSMDKALENVSEKTGDLAVNQKFLNDITERLGLQTIATTRSFKSFFAAFTQSGGGPQQARDIYEAASEAAANLKLSQEESNGVMLAFGQIASKGKVQAEELRGQIGERVPGAFGIAARAMNMTTAELDKAMSKGEIYSKDFLPKFATELKKTYGSGQEPVRGLQAELNRVDNMITKVGSNKSFIAAISTTVSVIALLATTITKVPFSVWLTFIGFLTLAYWSNVQALIAKNIQLAEWVIRMGLGNALIVTATALETAHAVVLGIVNGAYQLLIGTMNLFGISTVRLRAFIMGLNLTLAATPWGWILAMLAAVGSATMLYAQKTENVTGKLKVQGQALKDNATMMKVIAEINKQVSDTISGQMGKIERLNAIIKNNNLSLDTRKRALNDLIAINPKYLEGLTLENFTTAQGTKILDAYKNKLLEVAKAKAAIAIYDRKAAELFEAETSLDDLKKAKAEADKYKNNVFDKRSWGEFAKGVGGMLGIGEGDAEDKLDKTVARVKTLTKDLGALGDIIAANNAKGINPDDPILNGDPIVPDPKKDKDKTYRGSRLTGEQRDYLKNLEAMRDKELADLEKSYIKGEILEREYIERAMNINVDFYVKKSNFLKGRNAEELKQKAEADLAKEKTIKDANDKLFEIDKKDAEKRLEQKKQEAQRELDIANSDEFATDVDKTNAEILYYQALIVAQIDFNNEMNALEKIRNQQSKDNAEKRAADIAESERRLIADLNRIFKERFLLTNETIKNAGNSKINENNINAELQKQNIILDQKLTRKQREIQLAKILNEAELKNLQVELTTLQALINSYSVKKAMHGLTEKEKQELDAILLNYQQIHTKLLEFPSTTKKQLASPSDQTTKNYLKENLLSAFNLDEAEYGDLIGDVIAGSFDLATTAMNNYFESERAQVEKSKELAYQRIDLEKEQYQALAQSQGEKESLERQADEKKKAADREAGERLKKIKKQELQMALAMELANIGVAAASNPLNGVTFGGAGIAMYSLLAGIALAKYAVNLSAISKAQYGRGGKFRKMFGLGGRLDNGSYHSENGGMPIINPKTNDVEAFIEKDEAIINKFSMRDNNRYTVSGTPSQIASKINSIGGGVDWAGGATLQKFMKGGPYLGSNLRPPVFRSYYENSLSSGGSGDASRMERIEKSIEDLAELQSRESQKKVVVSQKEITDAQNEYNKQTEIATL
ncbi:tape measure protein [Soonwooa sp.]|uniref:tape measure protein n=1 Tax=Soonwooa sp. TaxID=1938592 RepID=UPI0028B0631D|nr:tape measure protein [Soonwooa sp.]